MRGMAGTEERTQYHVMSSAEDEHFRIHECDTMGQDDGGLMHCHVFSSQFRLLRSLRLAGHTRALGRSFPAHRV